MRIKIKVDLTWKETENVISNFITYYNPQEHTNKWHLLIFNKKIVKYFYNARKDVLYIENPDKELLDIVWEVLNEYDNNLNSIKKQWMKN